MLDEFLCWLEIQCPDFEIHQIKMKLGSLRIYLGTKTDFVIPDENIRSEISQLQNLLRLPHHIRMIKQPSAQTGSQKTSETFPQTMNFTSLDFETANRSCVSICAAGMAVFEDGNLTESRYWLVRPPKGARMVSGRLHRNSRLDSSGCSGCPNFPAIATELLQRLTRSDIVVAHNAKFDIGALYATLNHFGLVCPEFDYVCTCQLARRVWPELPSHSLDALAAHIGHQFNHHHAQADAEAAGRVLLAMMKQVNANTPRELLQNTGMEPKRFCH